MGQIISTLFDPDLSQWKVRRGMSCKDCKDSSLAKIELSAPTCICEVSGNSHDNVLHSGTGLILLC